MCAQFMIKAKIKTMLERFGLTGPINDFEWPELILPYLFAPILWVDKESLKLSPFQFSLIPSWSKEARTKFATHNARFDGLTSKATWKKPFATRRCIVPISDFIEPIYEGEFAGHMVRFFEKGEKILSAAALYDIWKNPKTNQDLYSFAIITNEPSEFVAKIGHDRQPVFLEDKAISSWLDPKQSDTEALLSILAKEAQTPKLDVASFRQMKAGWEKRKKA